MFSVGYDDLYVASAQTAKENWTAADVTKYNFAASLLANYPVNPDERQRANAKFRRSPEFSKVFAQWVVDKDWNGKGPLDLANHEFVFPVFVLHPVGLPDPILNGASQTFWAEGLRFQSQTPLLSGHDYSGSSIKLKTTGASVPKDAFPQKRPPFVVMQDNDGKWQDMSKPVAVSKVENAWAGVQPPLYCTVSMLTEAPGFEVRVHGEQHKIASSDFVALAGANEIDSTEQINWKAGMFATVYCQSDDFCFARYPANLQIAAQTLTIDVGDQYRLDYVAPKTVVDVDHEGNLVESEGGFIRDDRDKLQILARIAGEWYTTDRLAMELTYDQIIDDYEVGDLITTIGGGANQKTVNSVVTEVEWSMPYGSDARWTTTIKTDFGELDIRAFA